MRAADDAEVEFFLFGVLVGVGEIVDYFPEKAFLYSVGGRGICFLGFFVVRSFQNASIHENGGRQQNRKYDIFGPWHVF